MTKTDNSIGTLDIILLSVASLLTILVIRVCFFKLVDTETMGKDLLILSLSVSSTIFLLQYKALRKQKVFLAWIFLAVVMLGMFFWLSKNAALNYSDKDNLGVHNYASGLKVPLFF